MIVVILLFFINISTAYASRGCCSNHGGQNYCDTSVGKWVCNDGAYSPSCTCQEINSNNETANKNYSSFNKINNCKEKTNNENENNFNIFYLIGGCGFTYYLVRNNKKK